MSRLTALSIEQHDKLVAVDTSGKSAVAVGGPDDVSHSPEKLIACMSAERVVYSLEVIKVCSERGQHPLWRKREPLKNDLLQLRAIGQASQYVLVGNSVRLGLGCPAGLNLIVHIPDDQTHLQMIGDNRGEVLQVSRVFLAEGLAGLCV